MIRKGMYVRGTPQSDDMYSITNSECICKVIEVLGENTIVVEVVDSPMAYAIGDTYPVDTYYFREIGATMG